MASNWFRCQYEYGRLRADSASMSCYNRLPCRTNTHTNLKCVSHLTISEYHPFRSYLCREIRYLPVGCIDHIGDGSSGSDILIYFLSISIFNKWSRLCTDHLFSMVIYVTLEWSHWKIQLGSHHQTNWQSVSHIASKSDPPPIESE
jgi:hypothetical protein